MKVYNLSKIQLSKLKKLELDSKILNTEGVLYLKRTCEGMKVIKKLHILDDDIFRNKLYTVHALIENKENINIKELILPEKIVTFNNELIGLMLEYIDNINLKLVLNNPSTPFKVKLEYIKQIGIILNKIKSVRKYAGIKNFYIGDLHEGNFIVNKNTDKVNIIDLDSCRILNNSPFPSKYLSAMSNITFFKKYKFNFSKSDLCVPNENSDLYCYNIIILNCLYGDLITRLSISEYYNYINYLSDIGFNKDLIQSFKCLYSEKQNINPYQYLDSINDNYILAKKIIYDKKRNRI